MRNLFFFLYVSTMVLFSCREARPRDVLSFPEMRSVMWDMMRADQFMGDYIFGKDSLANKMAISSKWYGEILALHKVSQEEFKKSYQYYSSHPKLMRDLMDSVSKQVDTSVTWQPRPIDTSRRKSIKNANAR
jgi:hypothetical protein